MDVLSMIHSPDSDLLLSDSGLYLKAIVLCLLLTQTVYAADSNSEINKSTNIERISKILHNTKKSAAPLNMTDKKRIEYEFDGICIFCHIPRGANGNIEAPKWENTIKPSPTSIQELPR